LYAALGQLIWLVSHLQRLPNLDVGQNFAFCCAQDAEILPLRELRKQQRDGRNAVRSLFDDLDVTSEAELDQRLAEIDHRMSHESNTVADEKKMIAMIKKLEVWSWQPCMCPCVLL